MLITIDRTSPRSTRHMILQHAATEGLTSQAMPGDAGTEVIAVGGSLPADIRELPGVRDVQLVHPPYMLASLAAKSRSQVRVGDVVFGGNAPAIIAGPCSVEGRDATIEVARAAKAAGATMLRGGAFKPRTSPYSFQGMGEEGLCHLAEAREKTGLPVVTEVMDVDQIDVVARHADMLQVGSRNMANFSLLKRLGMCGRPVLLKRGFSATLEEFLMSAEYIMAHGNPDVVLCERGIRTADPAFRFNLDLNVVPGVKAVSHLPIIVDPSHGTGRRELVEPMSLAGIAAGADGLAIEVHPRPDEALSDGFQTITPRALGRIVRRVAMLSDVLVASAEEPHDPDVLELPLERAMAVSA